MDIHPVVIHFPIAFLTLYAFFEILRFKKLAVQPAWFWIKAVLVICGTIGAYVAVQAGYVARELNNPVSRAIDLHETYGEWTRNIFTLLALNYLLLIIENWRGAVLALKWPRLWPFIMKVRAKIFCAPVVVILAVLGFAALTITGALGGTLVYGPNTDPMAKFINELFF